MTHNILLPLSVTAVGSVNSPVSAVCPLGHSDHPYLRYCSLLGPLDGSSKFVFQIACCFG